MIKRLFVRLILGTAITAVTIVVAFMLHFALAGAIARLPENRTQIAALPGEGSSWVSGVAILSGWALLSYCSWSDIGIARWKRAVYIALFIAILSISFLNFAHGDMLINRTGQLFLNIVMIFLSLVLTVEISRTAPQTSDGIALRLMSIFFLVMGGVATPGFFSLLWCVDRLGIGSNVQAKIGELWISAAAAIVAAVTAGWSQRQLNTRQQQTAATT